MDSLPPSVALEVFHFSEHKGLGLEAVLDEEHWKVGSAKWTGAEETVTAEQGFSVVHVRKGDHLRGRFLVGSRYRDDLKQVLEKLSKDLKIAVLTGDSDREKSQLSQLLPASAEVRYQQSPQDKLEYIRTLQQQGHKVIMVGDGLNDAGALAQADAGISVAEDISAFTPGSDGILSGAAFGKLPELVRFSRSSMRVIRNCFFVSFGYNLTGLAFAVTGYLTPLVGAVLMPLSSVSVVIFTVGGITLLAKRRGLL
jgi:Cu+-exporting ATPase